MIGHITKQFFRSYIMSPRIVLLFLGLVIAICEAAETVSKPTISYSTTTGKLSCAFVASMVTGEICFQGTTTGCKVKFYLGAGTTPVHTSNSDIDLDYIPTRNGIYTCIAFKGADDSQKSDPPTTPVDDLVKLPILTVTPDPDPAVCGKGKITLSCQASTVGTDTGAAGDHIRIVKDGAAPAWGTDIPATMEEDPWVGDSNGKYVCQMSKGSSGGEKIAISDEHPVACTACDDNGADAKKCPDGSTCDTGANPNECKSDTTTTAAGSASGSTGGGSGSNTGSSGSGGGGVQTTGSGGGGGTTSGASDLGRPASLLTIVCSLLALTLSLRG